MSTPLRVLIVEDSEDDTLLMLRELRRAGYDLTSERVDTPEAMNASLDRQTWDVVLADYAMPRFSMPAALTMVKEKGLDLPFIIVSGAIGEETAVAAMRAGALDYVMKNNLARLAPAVERELREAEVRRERKKAEEALHESEERFRRLVEDMNDGYCVLQGSTIVFANARSAEMFGYSQEEVIGKTIQELLPSEIIEELVEVHTRRRRGETVPPQYETTLTRKDQTTCSVEFGARLIEYGGKPATSVVIRDITERKRAEEELMRLSNAVRMSTDSIVISDLATRIVDVNEATLKMYDTGDKSDLIGKNSFDLIAPEARERAFAGTTEVMQKGYVNGREYNIITKDGSRVPVEMNVAIMRDAKGKPVGFVGVSRDITERKRAEEERRRMEEQLQLASRLASVGELAAGVAHELNNPLAAVQAFAQLLNDRDDLDQAIKRDVQTIYKEAQRATRITGNLLSFARRHMPEKRLISINDVIEKTLELQAYQLKVNKIDLVMELDPDLPMTMADSHQMQQVFINIINNAEQAMIEAHGRGKLCVKTQRVGKMIQIAFTDDGPGILEENQKRMFDPFFTTKEVGRGTGLGLSICYGLVQEHGGHMSVRSKPGEGATFVVEIPIVSEDERTAQEADSIQVEGI